MTHSKYPFATLLVGESFTWEVGSNHAPLRTAAYAYGKRHGVKLVVNTQGGGVVKVTRVA